jgi:hypothetical protein
MERRISQYAFATAFASLLILSAVQELHSKDVHGAATCSTSTLNGSYGFYRTGETPGGPLAAVGKIIFDGNGNQTTKQTASISGEFETSKSSGRYEIAADCTLKILSGNGDLLLATGIIVDDGNGFFLLNRAPGNAFITVARKIDSN